jgi:starch synthase
MKVLIVSSEAIPYCKTGGLADVAGSLLKELRQRGVEVRLMIPLYNKFIEGHELMKTGITVKVKVKEKTYAGSVYQHNATYFIGCNKLFDRDGMYGDEKGDYADNALRFSFFCRAVIQTCRELDFIPDVIHLNDWQTALIPLYLKTGHVKHALPMDTPTVLTIHNLGYQGLFPRKDLDLIGVDSSLYNPEGIEFYGKVNFLKAGILYTDLTNTVSPGYAEEITTREHGFGLDGVLKIRKKDIHGILNGIDYSIWSPENDKHIFKNYSSDDLRGKVLCRRKLVNACELELEKGAPLISFIGRLSSQKGVDLITSILDRLMNYGM